MDLNQVKGFLKLSDGRIRIDSTFLKPGTVLAWPVFTEKDEMLHMAYRPFTDSNLAELIKTGNRYIYYSRQESSKVQYEKDLQSYLDNEVYTGPRTIELETQKKAVSAMNEIVQFIKNGQQLDLNEAKGIVEYVLEDVHTSKSNVVNLLDIRKFDDYTYTHSINVGTIAIILAKRMKLSDEMMFNVGLAGFLHDIGKLKIPNSVINKPGKLTEEEFELMKKHPRYGYEMVKNSSAINDIVKRLILFHHERADGKGYPLGVNYEKIGNLPFIIAIADFFDALTTARAYKRAFSSSEALKMIMQQSISHFPSKVVQRFMADMKDMLKESWFYEIGMFVLINTNEIARVVAKDNKLTTRPTVEILVNSKGELNVKPVRVNLNYDGTRTILKILDENEVGNISNFFK